MPAGRHAVWIFAGVSAALHWASLLELPTTRLTEPKAKVSATVEFTVLPPSQPEAPPASVTPQPPAAVPPNEPPPRTARTHGKPAHRESAQPMAASEAPVESAAISPTETAPALPPSAGDAPEAPRRPAAIDISPVAAANTLSASIDAARIACNPRSPTSERCEPGDQQAHAQEELTRSLQESAHTLAHLAKREPPQLQREADGSYGYPGSVFHAHIGRDGQVAFEDSAGAKLGSGPNGARIGFDLTDAIDSAMKHELYSAEKRWFLDQTVEVRTQLADAFRVEERAHARRYLEQALDRAIAANEDAAHKRAAVFALWEDCGDDDDAIHVRRIVEAFVRTRMPVGSALGFSADELDKLNHDRMPSHRFDPYHVVDAGTPG